MFKVLLLAGLLSVAGCADAKSSSSSSFSRSSSSSSSSYKPTVASSSYKPTVASSSYKPKPKPTSNSCSGSVNPSVVYDWDAAEYEYECPSKRKMNRFGSCVCK